MDTSPLAPSDRSPRDGARLHARYGPWAVVTGASDGIGRALAIELARAGLHVVLAARRHEVLTTLADELSARYRVEARAVAVDLAQPDGVRALVDATRDLDVGLLVAAAGFGTSGDFARADLDAELSMIDVNCRAVAALSHAFAQRFVARGRGGLVLMSSLVAFQGVPRASNSPRTTSTCSPRRRGPCGAGSARAPR
jgi:uncharacterized protein